MPFAECNTIILEYNKKANQKALRNGIKESQYCAYDPNRKADTCEGDSGGPLQIITPESRMGTVVGVVSFGIACGTSYPSIYSRVAYYLDWIEALVWPNGIVLTPVVDVGDIKSVPTSTYL